MDGCFGILHRQMDEGRLTTTKPDLWRFIRILIMSIIKHISCIFGYFKSNIFIAFTNRTGNGKQIECTISFCNLNLVMNAIQEYQDLYYDTCKLIRSSQFFEPEQRAYPETVFTTECLSPSLLHAQRVSHFKGRVIVLLRDNLVVCPQYVIQINFWLTRYVKARIMGTFFSYDLEYYNIDGLENHRGIGLDRLAWLTIYCTSYNLCSIKTLSDNLETAIDSIILTIPDKK